MSNFAAARAGLRAMLADRAGMSIVGEAAGSLDLRLMLADGCADVVLCDVQPADFASLLAVASEFATSIVAIGADTRELEVLSRSEVATWAAVPREAEPDEIAAAIGAVFAGLIAISPTALASILESSAGSQVRFNPKPEGLSTREHEILQLMAEGLPNKQIAAKLSLSLHTVKFHAAALFTKLGVSSRTEAVTVGVRKGLVML